MKIVAMLEDFNRDVSWYGEVIRQVKEQAEADYLIAVTSGDFLEDGSPAIADKYARAQKAKKAGVDMVMEIPVCTGLSDQSTKVFSGIAMLKRLYSVDQVVILSRGVEGELLSQIGKFLFMAPPAYQASLKKKMKYPGIPQEEFLRIQAETLEEFFPAEKTQGLPVREILADPINRNAVEIVKAMYQFYWVIKPVYVDISEWETAEAGTRTEQRRLGEEELAVLKEEVERLQETLTPEEFQERLADTPDENPEMNNPMFLLKLLIGIHRGSLIIAGLRTNCPHGRILALADGEAEGYQKIKEKSWVPLLLETAYDPEVAKKERTVLDECGQMLAELDDREFELYQVVCGR